MPERLVVFNADDLGLSRAANEGIAAAVEAGLVRETSLVVTTASGEEGARFARDHAESLGVGLHLCLSDGEALTGRLRGLTDARGRFLPLRVIARQCVLRRPRRDEVKREILAQLRRVGEWGLRVVHLDGHHHAHVFPVVRDAVAEVVREEGIAWIRLPDRAGPRAGGAHLGLAWVARLAAGLRRRCLGSGVRALPCVAHALYERADFARRAEGVLARLDAPAVEWVAHPRAGEPKLAAELAALTGGALAGQLAARGARPARYGEAAGFVRPL